MDIALLVLRVVVGLYVAAHGAQKLFGWFGGGGINGTAGFFGGMLGFRPAKFWVVADGLAEFGGRHPHGARASRRSRSDWRRCLNVHGHGGRPLAEGPTGCK